ncbi:uncharacterized protein LY79DRAFT_31303 [Colletotrichum navitas]|uniref:Uncharacterized protein n=1 Tax=Colletotrichum navitas TaxID=681940 RepID=A0AAD8V8C8_9PEZI|nr:uncharacterized protein LY79DRAFT_31303 [Colletotrichum navitas]KAK1596794.1 hypothetical protein LY79DRAFT_31303 [Colletotrichum navitas]
MNPNMGATNRGGGCGGVSELMREKMARPKRPGGQRTMATEMEDDRRHRLPCHHQKAMLGCGGGVTPTGGVAWELWAHTEPFTVYFAKSADPESDYQRHPTLSVDLHINVIKPSATLAQQRNQLERDPEVWLSRDGICVVALGILGARQADATSVLLNQHSTHPSSPTASNRGRQGA